MIGVVTYLLIDSMIRTSRVVTKAHSLTISQGMPILRALKHFDVYAACAGRAQNACFEGCMDGADS